MTSKEVGKCDAAESRRRSPLDHLPPPANSNKPLTPFSIEDILNKPSVKRSYAICGTAHLISSSEKHRPSGIPLSSRALLTQTSPLCALEELASKTFKGLEVSVLQAAEGTGDGMFSLTLVLFYFSFESERDVARGVTAAMASFVWNRVCVCVMMLIRSCRRAEPK